MNESKSRQGEGYDYYDYAEIPFTAVEATYIAGANARAAMLGMGALDLAIWPISETYPAPVGAVPHNAQNTLFYADVPCLIRMVTRDLIARWMASVVAGAPFSAWPIPVVQVLIPATTWITLPDKWAILYVLNDGVDGTLIVKTSG